MKTIIGNVQILVLVVTAVLTGQKSYAQVKYIELDTTTSYDDYKKKDVDLCDKDTTITFRQGTRITMNRCEFLQMKDCFSLKEYNLDTTIQSGKMTTLSDDRKPLYSGGMVEINFCGDGCLDKPAIVQIPISKECAPGRMSLWTGTGDDDWVPDKPALVRTVRLYGVDYYEFKVRCSGAKNVAMLAPIADEVKFVMHDQELELTELRISYGCPNGLYRALRSRGAKTIEMNLPCPSGGPMIYAVAVSDAGDTLRMNYQPLNDLTRSGPISTCRAILKKDRKDKDRNVLYKKYTLYRRDFDFRPTVTVK
jgi:hypothetical protein